MRICDVDSFYSPRAGGVKTYHDRKLEYFQAHPEHDYTLIYADEDPGVKEISSHVRTISVRGQRMGPNYRFVINAVSLRRALDCFAPEVIEIGEPYFLPWVSRVARVGRRVPLVGYWHAHFPVTYVRRPVTKVSRRLAPVCERVAWWYARRTYGNLDAILTASAVIRGTLCENGLTARYHAPLGVDSRLFHPEKRDPALRASVGAPLHREPGTRAIIFFPHRLTE